MSAPQSPNSQKQEDQSSFQDKFKNTLEGLKSNEKLENLVSYATANTRDTVSYVLLIIGIILMFFHSFYGGALIGLIAGLYFSSEVMALIRLGNDLIEEQGIVKSLIAGGLLLALFISAPGIFIGFALAVGIRHLLFPDTR